LRRRSLAVGWLCAAFTGIAAGDAHGQRSQPIRGFVAVESRTFFSDPLSPVQPTRHSLATVLQPEFSAELSDRVFFSGIVRARVDQHDRERRYVDAREASLQVDAGPIAATLGISTVFWGVTESRHLVNVVNQTDYLDDLDGDEKFGQLMALLSHDAGKVGFFDAFVMSWFRSQRFPGRRGRPGVPLPVLDDDPLYGSSRGPWSVDLALRWSHSRGGFDWALSQFRGTSREPELLPEGAAAQPVLRPRYSLIDQTGIELQWTRGDWLWKAEGMLRRGQGPTFAATTFGFEYLYAGALESDADLALFLEYSYDGRDNLTFNWYDNDAFGGARLSLNDVPGTEISFGILWDVESDGAVVSAEASRRVRDAWKLEFTAQALGGHGAADPLYWFRADDHVRFALEYHF